MSDASPRPSPRPRPEGEQGPRDRTSDAAGPCYTPRLHVVLFQPEIPYNTGSVGRTCVAVGAKLWLVRPLGFRVDDYYLRRAGLDYWQHLEWQVVDDWEELLRYLPTERHWYFSARADRSYAQAQFAEGDVLVFGPESKGLPPLLWVDHPDRGLRIPVQSVVRSLNLSNTVAIAVYEARRQWEASGDGVWGTVGGGEQPHA